MLIVMIGKFHLLFIEKHKMEELIWKKCSLSLLPFLSMKSANRENWLLWKSKNSLNKMKNETDIAIVFMDFLILCFLNVLKSKFRYSFRFLKIDWNFCYFKNFKSLPEILLEFLIILSDCLKTFIISVSHLFLNFFILFDI